MAKANSKQLIDLVVKAVSDAEFRARLIKAPADAAKVSGVELDGEDVSNLSRVFPSLQRFSSYPNVDLEDVRMWALGAFVLGKALPPPKAGNWNEIIFSWTMHEDQPQPQPHA